MTNVRAFVLLAALAMLTACSSTPVQDVKRIFQSSKGDAQLQAGIRLYEDGRYAQATTSLQNALNAQALGK